MTAQKKIATSVEIMIHVGQFEHIKINKYGEKHIEYVSTEDMIKKEDELTNELTDDIIRTMRVLPSKLGKKTNAVIEIEEKIEKRIPEWLSEHTEPNIAKQAYDSNKSKEYAAQKVKTSNTDDISLDDIDKITTDDDLFDS